MDQIGPLRIVPVVVIDDPSCAEPVREALKAGGLRCAEVTLRTATALTSIEVMAQDPEFVVGAGTVTAAAQVERCVSAGARFVVSPGLGPDVVRECVEHDVTCLPGAVTATEIMAALDLGISTVKFFPAEINGGVDAISALAAPFAGVGFVPTGGIRLSNLPEYLAQPAVVAVGGTWLTPMSAQREGAYSQIARLTAEAVAAAKAPR